MPSKIPKRYLFLLVIGGVFFSLLILELAVRLTPEKQIISIFPERPNRFYLPSKSNTARGNVFNLNKTRDITRICVVGDSFTFGTKIQFFDAFPARLERLLNLNSDKKAVEVINYGSPGFSTYNEIASIEKAIEAKCDLIILQITLNDAQEKPLYLNPLVEKKLEGFLSYSKLIQLILSSINSYRSIQKYIDYHYNLFNTPDTQNIFVNSIEKIKSLTDNSKIPLISVVFPLFDFPLDEKYPFKNLHGQIDKILKVKNIPVLDLTRSYKNVDVKRIQLIPEVDSHPNEIGHRIAADAIYKWLKSENFLPDSLFTKRIYKFRTNIYENHIS